MNWKKSEFQEIMEDTDKAAHGSGMKVIETQEYLVVHGKERNKLNITNITK